MINSKRSIIGTNPKKNNWGFVINLLISYLVFKNKLEKKLIKWIKIDNKKKKNPIKRKRTSFSTNDLESEEIFPSLLIEIIK